MKNILDDIINEYPDFKFYILGFDNHKKIIKKILQNTKISIITDHDFKQKIMMQSTLALAASGSVTLELSKYKTPMVVVYDTNYLTRILIKFFVKVKFCSIINIFFNKAVVPEFVFEKFNYKLVINEMRNLLNNKRFRDKQVEYMKIFSKKMLNNENPAKLLVNQIIKN